MKLHEAKFAWLLMLGVLVTELPAFAQDNFYRGKTIRFIVAYEAGGGFNVYTRTIARHFAGF